MQGLDQVDPERCQAEETLFLRLSPVFLLGLSCGFREILFLPDTQDREPSAFPWGAADMSISAGSGLMEPLVLLLRGSQEMGYKSPQTGGKALTWRFQ